MFPRCFVLAAALATSATATATAAEWKHYVGTINGNVPITADLRFGGLELSGVYRYNRVGTAIPLQFKTRTSPPEASPAWTLEEFGEPDASDKPTGLWSIEKADTTLRGTWTSPDGATSFPLVLQEDYTGAAHIGEAGFSASGKGWSVDVSTLFPAWPDVALRGFSQTEDGSFLAAGYRTLIPNSDEVCTTEFGHKDWFQIRSSDLVYNGDGLMSLIQFVAAYNCGAHDFYFSSYLTLDLSTGRQMAWYDFVRPDGEAVLNRLLAEDGVDSGVRELGAPGVDSRGIWFGVQVGPMGGTVQIPWKKLAGYTTGHPITR
jgi:hypothetical protein